jgi:hypothetical protein
VPVRRGRQESRQRSLDQIANMKRLSEAYGKAAKYTDYREMLDQVSGF